MAPREKLTVRRIGDVAYIRMGDARKHLSTIIDDVLEKYPQVVLERRGTPVAVISRPETVDSPVVEEEF